MKMRETLNKLAELGLSNYEAKTYIALVQKNPRTAYEIGKASGIPSSKIYEVLRRLSEKGIILILEEEGKTRQYIPQSPEEFLKTHKDGIARVIDSLQGELQMLRGAPEISYIWNILDFDHLADRARSMIAAADKIILLSLWKEEFSLLEEELKAAEQRGVQIAAVHFGSPHLSIGQVYYHPIEDTLYVEKGGRGLVIVVDSCEVLIGNISYEGRTEGAWSRNKGFVTVAEDYVKHDIYIAKILRRFEKQLTECFGENYQKLRDVLHDREQDAISPEPSKTGAFASYEL